MKDFSQHIWNVHDKRNNVTAFTPRVKCDAAFKTGQSKVLHLAVLILTSSQEQKKQA